MKVVLDKGEMERLHHLEEAPGASQCRGLVVEQHRSALATVGVQGQEERRGLRVSACAHVVLVAAFADPPL
eukprot:4169387-Heterocapsa_arctica.AAC.1